MMAPQPVKRDQFGRRGIHVVQIARPCVLIERRDDGLSIRQHLPQTVSVDDFGIRQMAKDFQYAPFFG